MQLTHRVLWITHRSFVAVTQLVNVNRLRASHEKQSLNWIRSNEPTFNWFENVRSVSSGGSFNLPLSFDLLYSPRLVPNSIESRSYFLQPTITSNDVRDAFINFRHIHQRETEEASNKREQCNYWGESPGWTQSYKTTLRHREPFVKEIAVAKKESSWKQR